MPALAARLRAIVRQRCPICFQGPMFRGRFAMNPTCPVCGHAFEREPGFFQGAMYVSYGLGTLWLGALGITAHFVLVPLIGLAGAVVLIVAVHLASVLTIFRYSRVIWAHVNVGTVR